jgi:hypothetical protein
MEKTIRCTNCPWRGPWEIAESAPRIRASVIPPAEEEIQRAYAEHDEAVASVGTPTPPPCPMCGHHTVGVKLHGYTAVG